MIRYQIIFTGKVQGVGFRFFVCHLASESNCTGWVQNQWDGSVLCELQGNTHHVERILEMIQQGNNHIQVAAVQKQSIPVQEESKFQILH